MTDDLITFLHIRLDTDQGDSERAHYSMCSSVALRPGHPCDCGFPERRRAEVAAKRRILELHQPKNTSQSDQDLWGAAPVVCAGESWECYGDGAQFVAWPCPTMRLLALPYADYYGYREEWRP